MGNFDYVIMTSSDTTGFWKNSAQYKFHVDHDKKELGRYLLPVLRKKYKTDLHLKKYPPYFSSASWTTLKVKTHFNKILFYFKVMARKKERESKSALTERNTLIEEEKKLIELKAFVAKRALILKGLISNDIFIMFHYIFEPKTVWDKF